MNFNNIAKSAIALVASSAIFAPNAALANSYEAQIRFQLMEAAAAFGLGNYFLSHDAQIDLR